MSCERKLWAQRHHIEWVYPILHYNHLSSYTNRKRRFASDMVQTFGRGGCGHNRNWDPDEHVGQDKTVVKTKANRQLSWRIFSAQETGRTERRYTGCFKKILSIVFQVFCVASVTKMFTLKGLQTIRRSRLWTMSSLYAFKWKCFRNTRHRNMSNTIVKLSFWNVLYITI
jgi:hypothetical protein